MKKILKKIALCFCLISLWQINIFAQNEVDALRFSEIDWQGTARFMGAGKAFGAVGAEFSALNTNPASIGLYKKFEITFTPMTLSIIKNSTGYNNSATLARAVKYNIGSAGVIAVLPGISSSLWKKFQIGFGYNRIKNFNNIFTIEGRNAGKTIGSLFAAEAEGLDYRDTDLQDIWSTELWAAWDSFLIDTLPGNYSSYKPLLAGRDMFHESTVIQKGGIDEMIFSFGTNYDDKLFLGITIGVPFINYIENRTFLERNDKPISMDNFREYKITDKLSVRSTGINLKLGIIYQPLNFMRLGVAFHTPTYYGNIKDYFERCVEYKTQSIRGEETYANSFNYSLFTPLRAMANVAFFISRRAFISAEYEFANYGMASMYSVGSNFREENKTIQNMYGFSHIARIGAELNLTQAFALRAGYNYISSPYKNKINDGSKHCASAGFGFRTKYIYGDFAYTFTTSKEKYWIYDPEFVNTAINQFVIHRIMLTLGTRF
jgi:opacity protein-like surface antigen